MISNIYPPPPARNRTVDLVKSVAIFGVLLIHTSAGCLAPLRLSALFWNALARPAVPLFLMASGALLLPPERELTIRKLYTRNIARLLAALFFWAACYKLVFLALMDSLTPWDLEAAVKNLLLFRHEEHLYYLHIMLLVYAFLPLTRLLAGQGHIQRYALALWFLLGILYPTVRTLWPFTLLEGIPVQWRMNMAYASIGYTLLGHCLTVYHPHPRRGFCLLVLLAGFLLTFGGTWAASAAAGRLEEHFLEGMGVGVLLEAVGIWGLCASLPDRRRRAAESLSRASFCVFLTHVFFLQLFARHGLRAAEGPALVTVPLVAALVLLCGWGAYGVLSRIPGVRRWLI
ncbi:acyltransferase family protein [Oscillospiraceae bacterium 38-13]